MEKPKRYTYTRQYSGSTTLGAFIFGIGCLAVLFALALLAGYVAVMGVIGFHLYRAYHPASWPYIGQGEWFGIAAVIALFARPFRFSAGSSNR